MNVDILENNPDYKLYLYVSIPMFFIMMVGVLLWKYWTVRLPLDEESTFSFLTSPRSSAVSSGTAMRAS